MGPCGGKPSGTPHPYVSGKYHRWQVILDTVLNAALWEVSEHTGWENRGYSPGKFLASQVEFLVLCPGSTPRSQGWGPVTASVQPRVAPYIVRTSLTLDGTSG